MEIGQRVRVAGLKSRPDLNGRTGSVVAALANERYGVAIDGQLRDGQLVGDSLTPPVSVLRMSYIFLATLMLRSGSTSSPVLPTHFWQRHSEDQCLDTALQNASVCA